MKACVLRENPDCLDHLAHFFCLGGGRYLGLLALLALLGSAVFDHTSGLRERHDAARLALGERLAALDGARRNLALSEQMLGEPEKSPAAHNRPYLVISLTERRLWYKKGDTLLLSTRVATGSGKTLVKEKGESRWKFDTPRGRLAVKSKEEKPMWAPPDWYYVEQASKRKLALVHLERDQSLQASDGSVIKVAGSDVVREYASGRRRVLQASDGRDIIVDGKLLVPPLETRQRQFPDVLGTHRLKLGDGYALHGTNNPDSVGRAVSHGCVRLLNEDIARLYQMVAVGTPVYIY